MWARNAAISRLNSFMDSFSVGTPTMRATSLPKPSGLRCWMLAARPKTLPLTISPVIAGLILAVHQQGHLDILVACLTLIAAMAIQIGTNLHNDVSDFERGLDLPDRAGPPRATAQGWLSPQRVKFAAHMMFLLAFIVGIFLLYRGGWPILFIGIASIIAGYAYTSGPKPIAYGPFGELFVVLFFGVFAVAGTSYLQMLRFDALSLGVGIILGLPAAAVLLVNNFRDLESDTQAGRRTLSYYLSPMASRWLYTALLVLPLILLQFVGIHGPTWIILLLLPWAVILSNRLRADAGAMALNQQLAHTAQYQGLIVLALLVQSFFA